MSSAITIAAVVATAASVGGAAISANSAKKQASKTNARLAAQNADQIMLDMASRGAPIYGANLPDEIQGSQSAILPYYGGTTEVELFNNAKKVWESIQDIGGTPEEKMALYEDMMAQYEPANQASRQMVVDLVTGKVTDMNLADAKPVFEARIGAASARRDAGLEALQETLNEIDSIQAGKGYSGDSTGKRMLRFGARRSIGSQAGLDFANAKLENAEDERNIRTQGRQQQLSSLDLARKQAGSDIAFDQLAEQGVVDSYNRSIQPFSSFNIGTHEFTKPAPYVDSPDTTGAIASTAAGAINKYATSYIDSQTLANKKV